MKKFIIALSLGIILVGEIKLASAIGEKGADVLFETRLGKSFAGKLTNVADFVTGSKSVRFTTPSKSV